MRMLYLTSIDGLVVLGLYRCTSELDFLLSNICSCLAELYVVDVVLFLLLIVVVVDLLLNLFFVDDVVILDLVVVDL